MSSLTKTCFPLNLYTDFFQALFMGPNRKIGVSEHTLFYLDIVNNAGYYPVIALSYVTIKDSGMF